MGVSLALGRLSPGATKVAPLGRRFSACLQLGKVGVCWKLCHLANLKQMAFGPARVFPGFCLDVKASGCAAHKRGCEERAPGQDLESWREPRGLAELGEGP